MCRQGRPLDTPISHHIDFTGKKQWLEEAKKSHRVSGRDSALGLVPQSGCSQPPDHVAAFKNRVSELENVEYSESLK